MTHIENRFNEEGTYVFTCSTTFTPTVAKYHWTDENGTAINSRSSVSISSPSTATQVTLNGDDLAITDATKTLRVFTFYGTYSGGTLKFSEEVSVDGRAFVNIS